MSLGMKITVLVVGGAVAVAALGFFLLKPIISGLKKPAVNANAPAGQVTEPTPVVNAPAPAAPKPLTTEEKMTAGIKTFSLQFAERFGTYAVRGNFENFTDLYPLMTERMRAASEKFVEEARARQDREGVSSGGVTTRALEATVTASTPLSAAVSVTVQRTETSSSGSERIYYQKLLLALVKAGDLWKVDSASWRDAQ